MNKECEEIQENLSAYLDGELSGDPLTHLQGHLDICQPCQASLEAYSKIGQLLRKTISHQTAEINLGDLPGKIQKKMAPSTRLVRTSIRSSGRWPVARPRRHAWQLAWAAGLALMIALVWLGPRMWETPDQRERTTSEREIQEQLGQVIRDTARLRFVVLQASGRQQEELGQLIRDHSQLRWVQAGLDESALGEIQERLGHSIRDHARARWSWVQQSGELQEKMGSLIQAQARQHTQNL